MAIKVKRVVSCSDKTKELGYSFWCAGCEGHHMFHTQPHKGGRYRNGKWEAADGPVWKFNGDLEKPTFSPSLLVYEGRYEDGTIGHPRCHSFVRDGQIQFLGDCGHKLAGQTIDLLDIESAP